MGLVQARRPVLILGKLYGPGSSLSVCHRAVVESPESFEPVRRDDAEAAVELERLAGLAPRARHRERYRAGAA